MSERSFRVRPECIEQVKSAYKRRYARQEDLSEDAAIGLDTVRKFLNGKSVNRENFWQLCERLELEWETIADLDSKDSNISSLPVNKEPNQATPLHSQSDQNFVGRENALTTPSQDEVGRDSQLEAPVQAKIKRTKEAVESISDNAFQILNSMADFHASTFVKRSELSEQSELSDYDLKVAVGECIERSLLTSISSLSDEPRYSIHNLLYAFLRKLKSSD